MLQYILVAYGTKRTSIMSALMSAIGCKADMAYGLICPVLYTECSPSLENEMPQRQIYKSSNGDTWFLCRNELGHVYVVHEPNAPSGGKPSMVGLGDFLSQKQVGPEHQALLALIGSIVGRQSRSTLRDWPFNIKNS